MRQLMMATLIALPALVAGCASGVEETTAAESPRPRELLSAGRLEEAAAACRSAAEEGDIAAQYTLGVLLALDAVAGGEPSEAIDWYRRVAEQGDAEARFKLGQLFLTGAEPLEVSERVRQSWVERLARLGEARTPLRVGSDYPMGSAGLPPDPAEAFAWFSAAAEDDHLMAWRRLAEMRANGNGSERDLARAHMWFSLLAERGVGNAGVWTQVIRDQMTDAEVAESARLLEAFRSRPSTERY